MHEIGYCTCPCYDALIKVAQALKTETALRQELAKVSPEVLAAITLAGGEDEETKEPSEEVGQEVPAQASQ